MLGGIVKFFWKGKFFLERISKFSKVLWKKNFFKKNSRKKFLKNTNDKELNMRFKTRKFQVMTSGNIGKALKNFCKIFFFNFWIFEFFLSILISNKVKIYTKIFLKSIMLQKFTQYKTLVSNKTPSSFSLSNWSSIQDSIPPKLFPPFFWSKNSYFEVFSSLDSNFGKSLDNEGLSFSSDTFFFGLSRCFKSPQVWMKPRPLLSLCGVSARSVIIISVFSVSILPSPTSSFFATLLRGTALWKRV